MWLGTGRTCAPSTGFSSIGLFRSRHAQDRDRPSGQQCRRGRAQDAAQRPSGAAAQRGELRHRQHLRGGLRALRDARLSRARPADGADRRVRRSAGAGHAAEHAGSARHPRGGAPVRHGGAYGPDHGGAGHRLGVPADGDRSAPAGLHPYGRVAHGADVQLRTVHPDPARHRNRGDPDDLSALPDLRRLPGRASRLAPAICAAARHDPCLRHRALPARLRSRHRRPCLPLWRADPAQCPPPLRHLPGRPHDRGESAGPHRPRGVLARLHAHADAGQRARPDPAAAVPAQARAAAGPSGGLRASRPDRDRIGALHRPPGRGRLRPVRTGSRC